MPTTKENSMNKDIALIVLGFKNQPTEEALLKRYVEMMADHHPDEDAPSEKLSEIMSAFNALGGDRRMHMMVLNMLEATIPLRQLMRQEKAELDKISEETQAVIARSQKVIEESEELSREFRKEMDAINARLGNAPTPKPE